MSRGPGLRTVRSEVERALAVVKSCMNRLQPKPLVGEGGDTVDSRNYANKTYFKASK